ncbi:dephospho-CoA kinase [Candidatus Peregrinibacteria bacterium]|nr:MAG: dephospho-CoA kinase [Candidatus Peregrinibacteria bacterium]
MVLGITGISGSGKQEASRFFEQRGWVILNADELGHQSYRPYTLVWKTVVREFGEGILNQDDTINRQKLSQKVFDPNDPIGSETRLKKLNEVIHPYIHRRITDFIHRHFRRGSNIVVEGALWQELKMHEYCDKIILLTSTVGAREKRIMQRDHIPAEIHQMRIKNQNDPERFDYLIENNGSVEDLFKKLNVVYKGWSL